MVDSGSSDRSAALASERGAQVVELERNAGFGAGCNAGMAFVEAPVTALVNPDVELLDAGLAELVRRAQAADAILAPRLLNEDGNDPGQRSPAARAGSTTSCPPCFRGRYSRQRFGAATSHGGASGLAAWAG